MKTGADLARLEEADALVRSLMPEPGCAERLERAVSTATNGPLRGLVVGVAVAIEGEAGWRAKTVMLGGL